MGLATKTKGTYSTIIPEGYYQAVCVCIDVGPSKYDSTYNKANRSVFFFWELLECREYTEWRDVKKFWPKRIRVRFTSVYPDDDGLTNFVERWIGEEIIEGSKFDLANLLGRSCILDVRHVGRGFADAEVVGISPSEFEFDTERESEFKCSEEGSKLHWQLPDWIINKIKKNEETKIQQPTKDKGVVDDDEMLVNA